MTNFKATLNIPDGPDNPSDDQPNMEVNNNSMINIWDVNHVGFNKNNGGFHTVIQQITQSVDPAAILNINQVYSKSYTPDYTGATADTQLFTRTGLGGISQLTGANSQSDGWQWLGSILIQWGNVTGLSATTTATITFKDRAPSQNIPFPNNCFLVTGTPLYGNINTPNQARQVHIKNTTLSRLSFTYTYTTQSSAADQGFFWIAIGN